MTWVLEKLEKAIYPLLLIAAGVGGLYVEVVERFFPGLHFSQAHERALTLALLALLAIALGIERYVRFARIDAQFERVIRTVDNTLAVRLLTEKEVTSEAGRLVNAAEESIKVLLYERAAAESKTISEEISMHLKKHGRIHFYMVLVADLSHVDEDFWRIHGERYEAYVTRGVEDRFHRYIVDSTVPIGFTLLIIDDNHLGISFSSLQKPPMQHNDLALRFWNQPEISREVGAWFQKVLLTDGIAEKITVPYKVAEEEWRERKRRMNAPSSN